jgi:curved DNA-binding protein CbpA
MKNRRNYYRMLQVQSDASLEVIRASYRALMLELKQHPDLGGSDEQASLLNEAYHVLSNPDLRAAYDEVLCRRTGKHRSGRQTMVTIFCPACAKLLVRKPAPDERCPTCASRLVAENISAHEKACQRAVSRVPKDAEVTYFSTWPGTPQAGKMVDLSPEGMRFLCKEKLVPDMVLKIHCHLFAASAWITNVREEVVDGERFQAIGVRFFSVYFRDSRGSFISASV